MLKKKQKLNIAESDSPIRIKDNDEGAKKEYMFTSYHNDYTQNPQNGL